MFCHSCQFVVSASGNYTVHAGEPDKLVEWRQIEQVVSHLLYQMVRGQSVDSLYYYITMVTEAVLSRDPFLPYLSLST